MKKTEQICVKTTTTKQIFLFKKLKMKFNQMVYQYIYNQIIILSRYVSQCFVIATKHLT
jgi:hypothetical protein